MHSSLKYRRILFILTIIAIFMASNIYTLIPIYAVVANSLDMPEGSVVLAGSLFTMFYGFGLLSLGPVSDYTGRKKIMIFGLLASAVTTMAVGISSGPLSLWLSRSAQGFTIASFASVAFAYAYDLFPFKQRTLLVVLINTGFLVAGIFGQVASSIITLFFSWNTVYTFFAVTYVILFAAALIVLPDSKPRLRNGAPLRKVFWTLLTHGSLAKCYLIAFTLLFSVVAFYDSLGRSFSGTDYELFTIRMVGLIGAIVSLFTGKLIEKYGEVKTVISGLVMGATSTILILLIDSQVALVLFSILFVSSISLLIPTVITMIGTFAGDERAKALSLYSFVLLTGASLAPPIVSLVTFQAILLLLSVLYSVNLVLCLLLSKERKAEMVKEA
ncbi:MFS transporter [Bacillus sp. T33-2]|uniref:MFS transporter n=1 Tax=Bacillus sp. T33-2 TaxID=2054168 RepID=UPI002154F9E7|nr:MFS transporter [Bacillus sp. T33-2]